MWVQINSNEVLIPCLSFFRVQHVARKSETICLRLCGSATKTRVRKLQRAVSVCLGWSFGGWYDCGVVCLKVGGRSNLLCVCAFHTLPLEHTPGPHIGTSDGKRGPPLTQHWDDFECAKVWKKVKLKDWGR